MTDFYLPIVDWYRRNKRDLPWRDTKNPYFIWLSEIILQQTRVDQGMNYYLKFTKNYPTIQELAHADEQQVLADWQGLGYYSRARNLHHTAKEIVENYQGIFPEAYHEILKLKGIGSYTAAAIASFSYDQAYAVLDGNVFRVLSRVFDVDFPIDSTQGKNYFQELAQELLPVHEAASYNQAIMEFGALQCVPVNPNCERCILLERCQAYRNKTVNQRPVKLGKTSIRNRYFNYLVFQENECVVLKKRVEKDIWQHLYEFPNLEVEASIYHNENTISEAIYKQFNLKPSRFFEAKKHLLSHQHIHSKFWIIEGFPSEQELQKNDYLKIKKNDLESYPLPKLIERFFENGF